MDMCTTSPAGILSIWLLQKQEEEEELRAISHQTIYSITQTRMYDWKMFSSSVHI
jgi:hypothetical protein